MTSTTESFHKNSGYLDPKWLALYICYRLCDTENKAFPEKTGVILESDSFLVETL